MAKEKAIITILKLLQKHQTGISMLGKVSKSGNPFKVLISTILSARAKDTVSYPISNAVFKKYPDAKSLAKAKQKNVEKIIKSIGFYRNKAKNIIGSARIVHKQKYRGTWNYPKGFQSVVCGLSGPGFRFISWTRTAEPWILSCFRSSNASLAFCNGKTRTCGRIGICAAI